MRAFSMIRLLAWAGYPLVIYFGLRFAEPRYVALVLAVLLLARRGSETKRFLGSLSSIDRAVFALLLSMGIATAFANSEMLLRLYPAAMSFGMLLLFGLSLRRPPSMIERFARIGEPDLPAAGVAYTRRVTQGWCIFLAGNGTVALLTALWSSREVWAFYNGFVAYLLMGAMFGGEWIFRHYFLDRARS